MFRKSCQENNLHTHGKSYNPHYQRGGYRSNVFRRSSSQGKHGQACGGSHTYYSSVSTNSQNNSRVNKRSRNWRGGCYMLSQTFLNRAHSNTMDSSHIGSRLQNYFSYWQSVTSDPYVLQCIKGAKLPFVQKPPSQFGDPPQFKMSTEQFKFVENELKKLENNGSIRKLREPYKNGWFSPIFLVPKKLNNDWRLILDCSALNVFLEYKKFHLDHVESALNLVTENCWLGSVDIRQCFNHMAICEDHWWYLMFSWNNEVWCYTCCPNRLTNTPYIVTRVTRVLLKVLREKCVELICYIDDIFVCGLTWERAAESIQLTVKTLEKVGFVLNYEKSVLQPTQRLVFLSFMIDTVKFSVSLIHEKRQNIFDLCTFLLCKSKSKIQLRKLVRVIGKISATFPCSEHAPLHYRCMDRFKVKMLVLNNNNWNCKVLLNNACISQIMWWHWNVFSDKLSKSLHYRPPEIKVFCDASKTGWGSVVNGKVAKAPFSEHQLKLSINTKELLAVYYGVLSHLQDLHSKSILVLSDNTTCVSTVHKKSSANKIHDRIVGKLYLHEAAFANDIKVSISFIVSKTNVSADRVSRSVFDSPSPTFDHQGQGRTKIIKNFFTEWSLHHDTVKFIKDLPDFDCNFDLFASHQNNILPRFALWKICQGTEIVDSFQFDWSTVKGFLFCPFRLTQKCLAKLEREKVRKLQGVFPVWPSANFWPSLLNHICSKPILLPKNTAQKLFLPWDTSKRHPLAKTMRLCFVTLCSSCYIDPSFQKRTTEHITNYGWREATIKKHGTITNRWLSFCKENKKGWFDLDITSILRFLEYLLYDLKLPYRSVENGRRFVSLARKLSGSPFDNAESTQIHKFMQGAFNKNPPIPTAKPNTWDVNVLLDYFAQLDNNDKLSCNDLAGKMISLLLLAKMCRILEIMSLKKSRMSILWGGIEFILDKLTKTYTHRNYKDQAGLQCFTIPSFAGNKKLCPVRAVLDYLNRTAFFRNKVDDLVICQFQCGSTPHKAARGTITRWVKKHMIKAGLGEFQVKSHCHSSSMTAALSGCNLDFLISQVGWVSPCMFVKHYMRPMSTKTVLSKEVDASRSALPDRHNFTSLWGRNRPPGQETATISSSTRPPSF